MPERTRYKIEKRPLYRDEIKSALMDAITSGELKPGDRIIETRWAKELGVSQSPIREAIRELELIGVVESIPYKGSVVRQITRKEIEDTYKVRIALESMAIVDAIRINDPSVIESMKKSLKGMISSAESGDIKNFVENDVRFHEAFINISDNEVMKRLWKQCYVYDNTKLSAMLSGDSIVELAKRHEMLLTAIENRNEESGRNEVYMHFKMLLNSMKAADDD
ncbi:MAG TPA: hypothetical protein DCM49_06395 [Lachnospiraceae bacterium]|nr:hypothetical protein [Lachnospiraceae bacterium]